MYFYICDAFAAQGKYQKKLRQINNKLENLGIADEKENASPLRPIEMIVKDVLNNGKYTNIIAIGDDQTATQIINIIAALKKKITFGIIPLRPSIIAQSLGLPCGADACKEISSRKIKKTDLGKINNQYFLTSAEIQVSKGKEFGSFFKKIFKKEDSEITLDFNNYKITSNIDSCSIINIPQQASLLKPKAQQFINKINPNNGLLNIVLIGKNSDKNNSRKESELSFIQSKQFKLRNKNKIKILADGQTFIKSSISFEILPNYLEVIVGRDRVF